MGRTLRRIGTAWLGAALAAAVMVATWSPLHAADKPANVELLNVSYDPTRELYKALNAKFIPVYEKQSGGKLKINQSHGGSSGQARSVIEGLDADVVTLALYTDTDAIRRAGLIKSDWADRLPNGALPYFSTIVFVVRKGNPKKIKDWPDLVREGVEVITPSPKTSGNGKLSFLSAWGSVIKRGGSEADAKKYVTQLYQHTPVLDSGARGATITFSKKELGDVHLTWESEAHLEAEESKGALEIVYPSTSIRAEPRVAVVDTVVDRKGTRKAAEAYLQWLYTDQAQEIIAQNYYRPAKPETLKAYAKNFPQLKLFSIQDISKGWEDAETVFFADGGVFDQIYAVNK